MSEPAHQRLGPIHLIAGISRLNALTFLYAAFIGITLNTFVNFIQPYVLTEQLHIPQSEQGALTGNLVFYSEIVLLLVCGIAGLVADKKGRRFVFTVGFVVLALGFVAYGFVENSPELLLLRLWMALGVACINVMVSTVQADYPQEESRGKLVGLTGFCIGLGALFLVFVLSKLPFWYSAFADARTAGLYTLLTVALIAFLSALVMRMGLFHDKSAPEDDAHEHLTWRDRFRQSIVAAKLNPKVGLSYACAFVARSDLIVVGVFFSLWLTHAGISSGMSTANAVKTAGMYFGIVQASALVSAPLLGILNDRLDRLVALIWALIVAAVGYGVMGLITDPLAPSMIVACIFLGIGQMAVMLASQTLIGQEAPAQMRGAVMGTFSVCGAMGIMFITKFGGVAFDVWKPAPFVIVAVLNCMLLVAAVIVRRRVIST
ncbi:MAG: MFS transporter [Pseudomonadales bacterium]